MPDEPRIYPAVLLKAGELYLKGRNRPAFTSILVANIYKLIGRDFPDANVRGRVGKFLVTGRGHDAGLVEKLTRVFGANLVEEVLVCPPAMEAVKDAALELMKPFSHAPSFKVNAGRSWKKFPLTSTEINREVGQRIVDAFGIKVDLASPAVTLKVQVDSRHAYVSVRSHPGAGGLPVGSSGRALLLLSGGIDSPVAGWYAMRRGLHLECVHFHSPPYTESAVTRKVRDIVRVLEEYEPDIVLHLAVFTKAQEFIRDRVREDYRMMMYRWAMFKVASRLGRDRDLEALVTGESLGQVASQTIRNMSCLDRASSLHLLRPLAAHDKADTVARARSIGTFDISIRKAEDCCSLFVPRHPTTKASARVCLEYDEAFEEAGIYDECLASVSSD